MSNNKPDEVNSEKSIIDSMNQLIKKLDLEMINNSKDPRAKQTEYSGSNKGITFKKCKKGGMFVIKQNKVIKKSSARDYVRFSRDILDKLNEYYQENNYPNHDDIQKLSNQFGYHEIKIDNWFKHKRRLQKKQGLLSNAKKQRFTKERLEILKKHFFVCKRPTYEEYVKMSKEIQTPVKSIQNWFAFKRKQLLKRIISRKGADLAQGVNKEIKEISEINTASNTEKDSSENDSPASPKLEEDPKINALSYDELIRKKSKKFGNDLAEVLGPRLNTFIKSITPKNPLKVPNRNKKLKVIGGWRKKGIPPKEKQQTNPISKVSETKKEPSHKEISTSTDDLTLNFDRENMETGNPGCEKELAKPGNSFEKNYSASNYSSDTADDIKLSTLANSNDPLKVSYDDRYLMTRNMQIPLGYANNITPRRYYPECYMYPQKSPNELMMFTPPYMYSNLVSDERYMMHNPYLMIPPRELGLLGLNNQPYMANSLNHQFYNSYSKPFFY